MAFFKRLGAVVLRVVCCVGVVAGVTLGILGGGRIWHRVVAHPRLQLHHIEVQGAQRAREADILSYAQTALQTPMLTLDVDAIALGVRRHPWVRAVQVRRQFPDRLTIVIAEHKPTLFVALGGLYVAAEDGQLFKSFSAADKLNLPILTGLRRNETRGGLDAIGERVTQAIGLAGAIENHPLSLGALEELHWDQDIGWSAVLRVQDTASVGDLGSYCVRVYMGQDPLIRLPVVVETMQVLAQRHQTQRLFGQILLKTQDACKCNWYLKSRRHHGTD